MGQPSKSLIDCPVEYVTGGIVANDGSIWAIGENSGIYRYWVGSDSQSGEWMKVNYYTGYSNTKNFRGIAQDKQR